MTRPAALRLRTATAVALAAACALVSACSAAPHAAAAPGGAAPTKAGGAAQAGTAGGAATGGTTGGANAGVASYVLAAPAVAAGYPQGQPSAELVQQVNGDVAQNAKKLGLSGTPVHAYYDDRADGAWIFYNGVTGTGFDPSSLHDALDKAPAVTEDGAGDRITTNAVDTDPGPHGGRAICNTMLVQNVMLTTAVTTCSWFTTTTAAEVTLVIKGDGTNTKIGFTADDVAPIMRAIRADVEQLQH